jgi:hypothetical protein
MKIELSYEYSELDKEPQFGLVIESVQEDYARWIYFYLGRHLGIKEPAIFTYKIGEVLYDYKYLNDAEKQGLLIANKIVKQLNKLESCRQH